MASCSARLRPRRVTVGALSRLATIIVLVGVGIGLSTSGPDVRSPAALIDHISACHDDTAINRTYTHGDPRTGLVSRHGYYYLDVAVGPDCPLGADGLLHVVAHVHALRILPGGPGDTTGAYVPDDSHHAMYWLEFHGYASTGRQYSLAGANTTTSSPYVTTTDHEDNACFPNGSSDPEVCQDGPGTSALTLRYDGPDDFSDRNGGDIRFRIANESGVTITDFAQVDIVASSRAAAPIVG